MIALLGDLPLNCLCGWRLLWKYDWRREVTFNWKSPYAECECGLFFRARVLEPIVPRRPRYFVRVRGLP